MKEGKWKRRLTTLIGGAIVGADQGLPIFGAGVAWGIVRFWPLDPEADGLAYCLGALAKIWPTLVCCVVGGALAGVAAHFAKKVVPAWRDDENK